LKTVLPNTDFVIEGYVDPTEPLRDTDPQRESIFIPQSRDPSDVLDHATSEIASGSKLGIDATKKIPGEGFKRPWPPLIRMSGEVRKKVNALFRR